MGKYLYKITNKINNMVYIGVSNNPERRFYEHIHYNYNYTSLIHRAIQKYGVDNFDFEVLGFFEDYEIQEKEYIKYYNSQSPNGYNIQEGGNEPPHHKGEQHYNASITLETAQAIQRDLININIPLRQIKTKYNISQDMLRHIIEGRSWRDETLIYPLRPPETELNLLRANKVKELLQNTSLSQIEIGNQVGWKRSMITSINIGQNYHDDNIEYPIRKK